MLFKDTKLFIPPSAPITGRCCYTLCATYCILAGVRIHFAFSALNDENIFDYVESSFVDRGTFTGFYVRWQKLRLKRKCSHVGVSLGREILQTYLAPNELSAIKKLRPNVFAKCARAQTQVSQNKSITFFVSLKSVNTNEIVGGINSKTQNHSTNLVINILRNSGG
jgi:hypothetical protein